ncbi:spindle and kinetochore-associated protein 2-like [Octodon degus]|uniref:Protein FAM33A n=1 Tax=Octodon degus TaxID=10160 RepID=A0A6P3VDX6_OCTDE|nr:spindle and kinetochore-associated protein 2-like [Octodon degus]
MEAEVDELELMFQKGDSDLDFIQYRLEYEITSNHHDSAGEKNSVTFLKALSAIRSRNQTLYACFKPVATEQETKSRICTTLKKITTMIEELQEQADVELLPLTEEEKTGMEQLKSRTPYLRRNGTAREL